MPTTTTAQPGVPEVPSLESPEEPGVPKTSTDTNETTEEAPTPTTVITQPEIPPLIERRRTRSQTYEQHPIGTIVRKWFNDNRWHEGEVTGYDAKKWSLQS